MDKRFKAAKKFQSTLPARGATAQPKYIPRSRRDFNPRSPHGERRHGEQKNMRHRMISIHAPRTGSDSAAQIYTSFASRFQSTLPARGATTWGAKKYASQDDFNPRSPHGERRQRRRNDGGKQDFNPRSPHGERPPSSGTPASPWRFQSTLPARGATGTSSSAATDWTFQSTLPARGATCWEHTTHFTPHDFNPRSPHGERLASTAKRSYRSPFQSTLPARGATSQ